MISAGWSLSWTKCKMATSMRATGRLKSMTSLVTGLERIDAGVTQVGLDVRRAARPAARRRGLG